MQSAIDIRRCGTVVHIGFHKTGSTAIQRHLASSARALLKQRVYYPTLGSTGGHHNVVYEIKKSRRYVPSSYSLQDVLDERARLDPGSTLLLSSESFCSCRKSDVRELVDRIPKPVHVVAYVRPQDEFFESLYLQATKHGENVAPFREYVEHQKRRGTGAFMRRLRPWRLLLGPENVSVRLYDRSSFEGGTVVRDISGLLGLQAPERDTERNPSVGAIAVEIMRRSNALLQARLDSREQRDVIARRVVRACGHILGDRDTPFVGFTQDERVQLRAFYEEDTRRLCRQFGIRPMREWTLKSAKTTDDVAADITPDLVMKVFSDALVAGVESAEAPAS